MAIDAFLNTVLVDPEPWAQSHLRRHCTGDQADPTAILARVETVGEDALGLLEPGQVVHVRPEVGTWVRSGDRYLLAIEDHDILAIEEDDE